ncbi:hypothetical protein ACLOJK_036264 [Asimina triloba]
MADGMSTVGPVLTFIGVAVSALEEHGRDQIGGVPFRFFLSAASAGPVWSLDRPTSALADERRPGWDGTGFGN